MNLSAKPKPMALTRFLRPTLTFQYPEIAILHDKFTNFHADAPSGFVCHAKLPLQFLAAHDVTRRDKQKDCIEPDLKGRPCVLENCPGSRMNMIAAIGTRKRPTFLHTMERRFYATFPAYMPHPKTHFHYMIEASLIVGEAIEEITD
jgi:hypothetical protein